MSFEKNFAPDSDAPRRIDRILARADQALTALSDPVSAENRNSLAANRKGDSKDGVTSAPSDPALKTLALDVEFGRIRLPLTDVASLRPGTILSLGRPSPSAVSLYCGGHLVAEGEILVQNNRVVLRITRKFPLFPVD